MRIEIQANVATPASIQKGIVEFTENLKVTGLGVSYTADIKAHPQVLSIHL